MASFSTIIYEKIVCILINEYFQAKVYAYDIPNSATSEYIFTNHKLTRIIYFLNPLEMDFKPVFTGWIFAANTSNEQNLIFDG